VRKRELAIRSSLGAQPGTLIRTILQGPTKQLALGIILGLVMNSFLGGILASALHEVDVRQPLAIAAAILTVTASVLCPVLIQIWTVRKIDPASELRAP
jgi:hypothetical protein